MKIGFHLNNSTLHTIDYRNILEGNPGVGGTEYAIISIATLLSRRNNQIDVVLYAQNKDLFPENLCVEFVTDINDAVIKAIEQNIQILVVNYKELDDVIVLKYKEEMKFIIWCHNFVSKKKYDFYANQSNILRIVHVGREQCDLYRDHIAFEKSDYIYNGVSITAIDKYQSKLTPYDFRENNVVYIGSLIKVKGFHILAKAWKKVLKIFPDANLYVVGSGKLYDRNSTLGKWNIADSYYENKFMQYLIDKNGDILPSVHFMGIMGKDKNDLLLKCKVGAPNPSGISETFGYTAIEMQAMGCIVTTMRCPGYLDTVYKTGILYHSTSQLANSIIKVLQKKDNYYKQVCDFIKDNFDINLIVSQWETLFENCARKEIIPLHDINQLINPNYHCKKSKEIIRRLKRKIPLLRYLLPLDFIFFEPFDLIDRGKQKIQNILRKIIL
jgi:glycosyltransferase involved in cell wall biosynthesis